MTCAAIQHSDQMQCGRCGLAWDVNDEDPPACGRTVGDQRKAGLARALAGLSQAATRAGLVTGRANEQRPLSAATVAKLPQAEGVPIDERRFMVVGGRPTTEAERWMQRAVVSGEVLHVRTESGKTALMVREYCMPAELPEGALNRMAEALCPANGEVVAGEGLRAAYRELLAYLGQA